MLVTQRFQLFRDDPVEPLLVASFDDLQVAKEAMNAIASHTPGQYFVWIPCEETVAAQLFGPMKSKLG